MYRESYPRAGALKRNSSQALQIHIVNLAACATVTLRVGSRSSLVTFVAYGIRLDTGGTRKPGAAHLANQDKCNPLALCTHMT